MGDIYMRVCIYIYTEFILATTAYEIDDWIQMNELKTKKYVGWLVGWWLDLMAYQPL